MGMCPPNKKYNYGPVEQQSWNIISTFFNLIKKQIFYVTKRKF